MITDLVTYSVNTDRIFNQIAVNTGVNNLGEASSIRKIVEPILNELENIGSQLNTSARELYVDTCLPQTLQQYGASIGLYRTNYQTIGLSKYNADVSISIDNENVLEGGINFRPFKRGDTVSLNNTIQLTFNEDIIFNNPNEKIFFNCTLTPYNFNSNFVSVGRNYNITSPATASVVTSYLLTFNRDFGVAQISETIDDFRVRIKLASELKIINFKSILYITAKEIPGIADIEVDESELNLIKNVYLYTINLYANGEDEYLDLYAVPLYRDSINKKINYPANTNFTAAKPLKLSINIINIANLTSLNRDLDNIRQLINAQLTYIKDFTNVSDIKLIVIGILRNNGISVESNNITLSLQGLEFFEADSTQISDASSISIPLGRFLYLTSLTTG